MVATSDAKLHQLDVLRHGLPNLCGWESEIRAIAHHTDPIFLSTTPFRLNEITAGFACALHMHQPSVPAGWEGAMISNLQYMFDPRWRQSQR